MFIIKLVLLYVQIKKLKATGEAVLLKKLEKLKNARPCNSFPQKLLTIAINYQNILPPKLYEKWRSNKWQKRLKNDFLQS